MNIVVRIVAAAAVLVICSGGVLVPTASAAASTAAKPAVYDCYGWHRGQLRPQYVTLDCGFDNAFLAGGARISEHMRWTWKAVFAYSRAVLWVNKCTPDCAAGHYSKYRAELALWRPKTHRGVRYFSRMTLRYWHNHKRVYRYKWYRAKGASIPVWHGGPA
jgi:hypothetical protein